MSPQCREYIIGITSRSARERFRAYRQNDYQCFVILADRLSQRDALELEQYLHPASERNDDRPRVDTTSLIYLKYWPMRRESYVPSTGGLRAGEGDSYSVYMVWFYDEPRWWTKWRGEWPGEVPLAPNAAGLQNT